MKFNLSVAHEAMRGGLLKSSPPPGGCTLPNRRGGSSEERVHLHVLTPKLCLADVAARERRERDGSRA